jgi:microcystin-dependent protein
MIKRVLFAFAVIAAMSGAAQAQTQYTILGSVLIFAGNFCPFGYMPMNGQLLPINQNQALFSILGTTYGGNGTYNFALPNALPMKTATGAALTQCIAVRGIFPSRN